jgi:hypothetical protein
MKLAFHNCFFCCYFGSLVDCDRFHYAEGGEAFTSQITFIPVSHVAVMKLALGSGMDF